MTVKDIANIHNQPVKEINRRINDNRERFKIGIDLIDLKCGGCEPPQFLELGYTAMMISKANNIYILSERGYSKLLKILEDDTAWELYDQLVDGYFAMREAINKKLPTDPMEILRLVFDANDNTNVEVSKLDKRVNELEVNKPLTASDYGYITRLVSQRVGNVIKERHLKPTQEQKSQLYKDLNSEVKKIAQVPHRSQLRMRHYDMVIDFIVNWQPSTATMTLINQMDNEDLDNIGY
ncbi:ORF6C domain-containing protein [Listeria sp. SHR_NRA_18]|uniref:ORF6C domain-containing protein n=1 Tax=Listeria sp. SHR_NRA_18 TaxID=2269046 RepID=UPI001374E17E|nr:ORF6C domain-containing protein [Listeria sp. SHR_NRA_18]